MKRIMIGLCLLVVSSSVHAQTSFFEGKTIRIVVGLPAGDVYDLYARMLADHMGKHIAGNPSFIVQNMAGASSMITANYVYNVAKPDGLTLGSVLPSLYFDQLVGRSEVQFDWAKFGWLGSFEKSNNLLYMRSDTPFKTIHDVTKAAEAPKCGSTGTGSPSYYLVKLMNEAIGTKFEVVTGYSFIRQIGGNYGSIDNNHFGRIQMTDAVVRLLSSGSGLSDATAIVGNKWHNVSAPSQIRNGGYAVRVSGQQNVIIDGSHFTLVNKQGAYERVPLRVDYGCRDVVIGSTQIGFNQTATNQFAPFTYIIWEGPDAYSNTKLLFPTNFAKTPFIRT